MTRTTRCFLAALASASAAIALSAAPLAAQAPADRSDARGSSVDGLSGGRDNTRVQGTVFDSQGKPMSKVEMWVMNDDSPSARMRMRTRSDGDYLVRGLGRLYTVDDVYGIVLRISFETPGYRTVEIRTCYRGRRPRFPARST